MEIKQQIGTLLTQIQQQLVAKHYECLLPNLKILRVILEQQPQTMSNEQQCDLAKLATESFLLLDQQVREYHFRQHLNVETRKLVQVFKRNSFIAVVDEIQKLEAKLENEELGDWRNF